MDFERENATAKTVRTNITHSWKTN